MVQGFSWEDTLMTTISLKCKCGAVKGYYKLEFAKGNVPESIQKKGMPIGTTIAVFWRLIKWKFSAGDKENLFFNKSGQSISKPKVLKTD